MYGIQTLIEHINISTNKYTIRAIQSQFIVCTHAHTYTRTSVTSVVGIVRLLYSYNVNCAVSAYHVP